MKRAVVFYKVALPYLLCIALPFLYFLFAYTLQRTEFCALLLVWGVLFLLSFYVIHIGKSNLRMLIILSVLTRLVFLFAIPNLSQDFYRFIWDGRMLLEGHNPYLSLPETWIKNGHLPINEALKLYQGMGPMSGSHFTNYPPVSQFIYWFASLCSPGNWVHAMIILRIVLILFDLGCLWIGYRILALAKMEVHRIFWYVLNPFIIIELTGNLHFEGVMTFFLLASLYLYLKKKWIGAGLLMGLSISVKLIPLLILPVFIQSLVNDKRIFFNINVEKLKRILFFYGTTLLTVGITFLPFLSFDFLNNFSETISLWFQNFEFNASIYYLMRWIGYQIKGWNIIATLGPILSLCGIMAILSTSFFRKNVSFIDLCTGLLFAICAYFAFSTTVHPWYLTIPLVLSIFTHYKFLVVWSFTVFLSYSAYISSSYSENLWLVALEYAPVYGVLIWEIFKKKKYNNPIEAF